MSRESKTSIRCREMGNHQEYVLKCPANAEEDVFARQVIKRLRGEKGLVVCIDTLTLNVCYGVNIAGYARNLVRELKEWGLPYRVSKYFGNRSPGFFRQMVNKLTGKHEHCIIAFVVPQEKFFDELIKQKLPGQGAVFCVSIEGENMTALMDYLVSPAASGDDKYERLYCVIADGREFRELSVFTKFLSWDEIQKAANKQEVC